MHGHMNVKNQLHIPSVEMSLCCMEVIFM